MRDEPKQSRVDKERARQFQLRPGESWHNGARVRKTTARRDPLVNPRKP